MTYGIPRHLFSTEEMKLMNKILILNGTLGDVMGTKLLKWYSLRLSQAMGQ